MFFIDIADSRQTRTGISDMPSSHSTNSNDGFSQFVAGSQKTASQHFAWYNSEGGHGDSRGFQKSTPALFKIVHLSVIKLK
jgi:hypothetical protein